MVGLDRMATGVDVDVAAGVESQRYVPRTNGSAEVRHWELVES